MPIHHPVHYPSELEASFRKSEVVQAYIEKVSLSVGSIMEASKTWNPRFTFPFPEDLPQGVKQDVANLYIWNLSPGCCMFAGVSYNPKDYVEFYNQLNALEDGLGLGVYLFMVRCVEIDERDRYFASMVVVNRILHTRFRFTTVNNEWPETDFLVDGEYLATIWFGLSNTLVGRWVPQGVCIDLSLLQDAWKSDVLVFLEEMIKRHEAKAKRNLQLWGGGSVEKSWTGAVKNYAFEYMRVEQCKNMTQMLG